MTGAYQKTREIDQDSSLNRGYKAQPLSTCRVRAGKVSIQSGMEYAASRGRRAGVLIIAAADNARYITGRVHLMDRVICTANLVGRSGTVAWRKQRVCAVRASG
jgi:hypothetical protein